MTRALYFDGDQLWLRRAGAALEHLFEAPPDGLRETVAPGIVAALSAAAPAPDAERASVRDAFDLLPAEAYAQVGLARQLLHWRLTHRFCGACGAPLTRHATERAMACAACGTCVYPRLNPVVITLVHDGDRVLLARRARGPYAFWSLVAGFVEAHESLEAAAAREVEEEVGVRVANLRYAGCQPWPFPNNLMVGFTAEFAGGQLRPDGQEIAEAGWFGAADLPPLPSRFSIARRLIDAFFAPPAG